MLIGNGEFPNKISRFSVILLANAFFSGYNESKVGICGGSGKATNKGRTDVRLPMKEKSYSAGMVSKPFSYCDFVKVMTMLNEGRCFREIREKALAENIFARAQERCIIRVFGFLKERAEVYDQEGIKLFCSVNAVTAKAMTLAAVLKTDTLFCDFMFEVYRDKIRLGLQTITDTDAKVFFEYKRNESQIVASWSELTYRRLRSNYFTYLIEAGMIQKQGKNRILTHPIFSLDFENYLINHQMTKILYAMTGKR